MKEGTVYYKVSGLIEVYWICFHREAQGLSPVSVDSLELLMDRLEKESYFQVRFIFLMKDVQLQIMFKAYCTIDKGCWVTQWTDYIV